jgi:hypothetical protein
VGIVVSEKEIFKVLLSSCDLLMHQTRTNNKTFKEEHLMIILINFGQNPSSGLGKKMLLKETK